MLETIELEAITTQVRRDILRMVHKVNSGQPGGSLGCAEFFVTLYHNFLKRHDDFSMDGIGEDLFFLSNGHISPVYYSVLARTGHFPVDELNTFRLIDARLQGLPTTHEIQCFICKCMENHSYNHTQFPDNVLNRVMTNPKHIGIIFIA